MDLLRRTFLPAAVFLVSASLLHAQTAADPSGHWTGSIQGPETEIIIEVDLAKNGKGGIEGTLNFPIPKVKLPLLEVAVQGRSVSFRSRQDQGFVGALSADGKSISGDFSGDEFSLPFALTWAGVPKIDAPPRSAAISKELAGTWNGTLDSNGTPLRVVLTLANHANGTATGRVVNLDQGSLEIPLAITQKASAVTLDFYSVGASYSGVLNAAGTELVGTYNQGPATVPLTFHRAAAKK